MLQLAVVLNALPLGEREIPEGRIVLVELNLAEAEHGVRGAIFGLQCNELGKGSGGFGVMVLIVLQRAEGPPAVGPTRANCEGFPVKASGFGETVFLAGFGGFFGKPFEILEGRRLSLRERCGRSSYNAR
jgi:hypothetical protein